MFILCNNASQDYREVNFSLCVPLTAVCSFCTQMLVPTLLSLCNELRFNSNCPGLEHPLTCESYQLPGTTQKHSLQKLIETLEMAVMG